MAITCAWHCTRTSIHAQGPARAAPEPYTPAGRMQGPGMHARPRHAFACLSGCWPPEHSPRTLGCDCRMPGSSKDSSVGKVCMENSPAVSLLRIVLATGRLRAFGSVYPTGEWPCTECAPGDPRGAARLGSHTGASGTGGSLLRPFSDCTGGILEFVPVPSKGANTAYDGVSFN